MRKDLAALYRICAAYGWEDLILGHISAKVPNVDGELLVNPAGLLFEEITPENLVKIDKTGNVISSNGFCSRKSAFHLHSAIHQVKPDVMYVMHIHEPNSIAVGCRKDGLLNISQTSSMIFHDLAYHDYNGKFSEDDVHETLALQKSINDKNCLILKNHGILCCGGTAYDVYAKTYFLVKACEIQVKAGHNASDVILIEQTLNPDAILNHKKSVRILGKMVWPSIIRKLKLTWYEDCNVKSSYMC